METLINILFNTYMLLCSIVMFIIYWMNRIMKKDQEKEFKHSQQIANLEWKIKRLEEYLKIKWEVNHTESYIKLKKKK